MDSNYMQGFIRDGYIVFPRILSDDEIASALSIVDIERQQENGYTLFSTSRELLSIFKNKVLPHFLSFLVEFPTLHKGVEESHIAINPCARDNFKYSSADRPVHIDGSKLDLGSDGVQLNGGILPHSFTVLCGVALTEQSDVSKGCLEVIPGSHKLMANFFREQVVDSSTIIGPGHGMWPAGSAVPLLTEELQPPLLCSTFSKLVPVLMRPGDLVICSYHLLHRRGYNVSDINRINLYWRVDASECSQMKVLKRNDSIVDELFGLTQSLKLMKC